MKTALDAEVLDRAAEIMRVNGEVWMDITELADKLRAQAARQADDLTQEEKLRRLLIRAEEAIQFMTGSADFGPGGAAHDGFMRIVHPIRQQIRRALAEERGE